MKGGCAILRTQNGLLRLLRLLVLSGLTILRNARTLTINGMAE